jgi:hypothetical protein
MKRIILTGLLIVLFLHSCEKGNEKPDNSGTVTLNNDLFLDTQAQDYYSIGFLFPEGEKVSTRAVPPPDVTVGNDGTLTNLVLNTNNLQNSFYKAGEYNTEAEATEAFKNLISATVPELQWDAWAYKIEPGQIWIYRSGTEHYTKIRIIDTQYEERMSRNYAECTFEWVYQPDGTLTFPGQ